MKPKAKQADQSAEFIRVAREYGADEEKSAADALMGKLAKTPPDPKQRKRRRLRSRARSEQ
ncbi:MAG: hypothetical protein E5V66_18150 [Mesorhizobium sp.]|uniref:hypothetical protein n=1 Tax=Mesorhizobium sp. TaxID=1871066 RepID=UPI001210AB59|nr:hypothetical protein [Mesorhizobium sp.]TIW10438.1 MAG: hypothetical protein E5V66_18150 [Mesorhizobium sp.]TIX73530.1 MAG: hypothetical protein E5V30_01150 [Mesorhizobium sp.]